MGSQGGGGGGWPGLRRGFRLPGARRRVRGEVDDELRFHLEGRIEDFVARGMTREQAEAEARRRFGDLDGYRRQACDIDHRIVRGRQRMDWMASFARETRRALRSLRRSPSFSLIAFVTLALGLGATTAIYTILEAVVLRPLPYRGAESLVSVMHPTTVPGTGESKWGMSAAGYFYFKRQNRTLADLAGYTTGYTTVAGRAGEGEAERVRYGGVTASVFGVLRARPAVGRLILPDDDRPGAATVAVLDYDFWRRRYGGDPAVVGRTVETSAGPVQVVGVAERGLNLPKPGPFEAANDLAGFHVDMWIPLQLDDTARAVNSHQYSGIARLEPGVRADEAQADLAALTRRLPELFPSAYSQGFMDEYHFRMGVIPLRDEVLGERITRTLWVLFAAVGLVLVIACANVANLFLVRMETRRRESAVRSALGADRAQMAVHYLAESLLLTATAGAAGVAVAWGALRLMLALAPGDIPRLGEVGLSWTAVAFAAALSIGAGLVFGLFPLQARVDMATLREGSRGLSASPRRRAVRDGLVVAQVALALMLLAGAGLMIRSFARLRGVQPGLDARGVLVFTVAIPGSKYKTSDDAAAFHRDFQARLAALPGVQEVGATTGLPLRDFGAGCAVVFREGRPYAPGEEAPCVAVPKATPGFFRALGIQVQGRAPDWSDVASRSGAIVVTKALADRLWPGEDPIGKGLNSGGMGPNVGWYRVVGVVPSLHAAGLDKPPTEMVFYPSVATPGTYLWGAMRGATYVLRTSSAQPTALVPSVRRLLSEIDPQVPLVNPGPMTGVVERSMARASFIMTLLSVAAGMALLLSAVGVYGVISYVVAQRRAEIGVRIALGARLSQVARLVVMQSVRLAVAGIAIGLAGALAGTRAIRSLLFEVSPTDPLVLAAVALVLLAIAVAASFAPARRAAGVNPVEALRGD
ncbi:MAG TPA: ABC transporter permease [Gemmatimonadaceae bacterium]|nr:ABC transporter permease [Gemmatimonadaceae bacterium]